MTVVVVRYRFPPEALRAAESHLRALLDAAPREPGCRSYVVNRAKDDAHEFLLYEAYDDDAALAAHRATPHFHDHVTNGILQLAASRDATPYTSFS